MTSAIARTLVLRAAKPPIVLPTLRRMADGRALLHCAALAALCAGKAQTVAELRLPGVTKRVPGHSVLPSRAQATSASGGRFTPVSGKAISQ
jgi:hypothetical protein